MANWPALSDARAHYETVEKLMFHNSEYLKITSCSFHRFSASDLLEAVDVCTKETSICSQGSVWKLVCEMVSHGYWSTIKCTGYLGFLWCDVLSKLTHLHLPLWQLQSPQTQVNTTSLRRLLTYQQWCRLHGAWGAWAPNIWAMGLMQYISPLSNWQT